MILLRPHPRPPEAKPPRARVLSVVPEGNTSTSSPSEGNLLTWCWWCRRALASTEGNLLHRVRSPERCCAPPPCRRGDGRGGGKALRQGRCCLWHGRPSGYSDFESGSIPVSHVGFRVSPLTCFFQVIIFQAVFYAIFSTGLTLPCFCHVKISFLSHSTGRWWGRSFVFYFYLFCALGGVLSCVSDRCGMIRVPP